MHFFVIVILAGIIGSFHYTRGDQNDVNEILRKFKISFKTTSSKLPVYSSTITQSCETLPSKLVSKPSAIATGGVCVSIFSDNDCKILSDSLAPNLNQTQSPPFRFEAPDNTRSFKGCKDNREEYPYEDYRVKFYEDMNFGRFMLSRSVSSECENLELWTQDKISSVTSNLCMNYYDQFNCNGTPMILHGNYEGDERNNLRLTKSFRPCNENEVLSPKFHKLTATILEFIVEEDKAMSPNIEDVLMGEKVFPNKRSSSSTQNYSDKKEVNDTVQIERIIRNPQLNNFMTAKNVTFKIFSNASEIIMKGLNEAYNFKNIINQPAPSNLTTTYYKFEDQEIEIPACSTCKVVSTVRFVDGHSYKYTAYASISGENILGKALDVTEFKHLLNNFNDIQEIDKKTVRVEFRGSLKASYYLEPERSKSCEKILNCPEQNNRDDTKEGGSHKVIYISAIVIFILIANGAIIFIYIRHKRGRNPLSSTPLREHSTGDNNESCHQLLEDIRPVSGQVMYEQEMQTVENQLEPEIVRDSTIAITTQLQTLHNDVMILEANVKKFVGPHFTKVYRTLQGDCSKLQMDLDKLNVEVEGKEELRKERRKLYLKIEKLGDELAEQAHSDGRICELCEVKE